MRAGDSWGCSLRQRTERCTFGGKARQHRVGKDRPRRRRPLAEGAIAEDRERDLALSGRPAQKAALLAEGLAEGRGRSWRCRSSAWALRVAQLETETSVTSWGPAARTRWEDAVKTGEGDAERDGMREGRASQRGSALTAHGKIARDLPALRARAVRR